MFKTPYLLITTGIILLLSACTDDFTSNESPCLPDNLQTLYESDAIRLSLRLQQNSAFADDIQIPLNSIERIELALAAVHQSESKQRDTITTRYNIHTLPYPVFDELTIEIDTAKAWTQAWKNGSRITGNNNIDDLMLAYGLQLDGYFSLSTNFVILTTTNHQALNLAALAKRFEDIEGVIGTDFEDTGGGGNNITAEESGTYMLLHYTVGYDAIGAPNNCNGACEFSRTWSFKVNFPSNNTDCPTAEFIEATGDIAP